MLRRTAGPLVAAAALFALLAVLATLQYRWIGQVSDAERDRLHATLNTRASAFVDEFDGAITRIYVAFQGPPAQLDGDAAAALSNELSRANQPGPALVKEVYWLDRSAGSHPLARLDPSRREFQPIDWPPALEGVRARLERTGSILPGAAPVAPTDAIDPAIPALVVSIPRVQRLETGGKLAVLPDPRGAPRAIVVVLDADRLRTQLIEPLVAKHFGAPETSDYDVTIARGDEPRDVVYTSSKIAADAADAARRADVTVGMFNVRMNDLHFAVANSARPSKIEKFAFTIVRRFAADGARLLPDGEPQGHWRLSVRGRGGSLDALVAASRRRNLAISLGILGLLGCSVALIIGSAQRQRRLARQQMEFVAAVSHELRTPLAVICSAGENLADGVVFDGAQVRRYGALVRTEGHRLAAMVERVMAFAGISSGAARGMVADVAIAKTVSDAVDGVRSDAGERDVRIAVRVDDGLPVIAGDGDALRSAVQNMVGNAVKYSAPGGAVDVDVRAEAGAIRIRVADRGLGIDAGDLPHVFEPFFRGRRALDAQVRGSGVGLTIVRHVADTHHGQVHIESRPGAGTTVTLELPVEAGRRPPQGAGEPAGIAS